MRLAMVGPPLSGKTTLFHVLTGLEVAGETSSDGGIHLGIFRVPDPRLDRLAAAIPHPKVIPVSIEVADIPGLSRTGSRGLDEKILGPARLADALIVVVRSFNDPGVPHPSGSVDPMADLESTWTDLVVADLASAEKRLERLKGLISKAGADHDEITEAGALARVVDVLERGVGAAEANVSAEEEKLLRGFGFLTAKSLIVVINAGDDQVQAGLDRHLLEWVEAMRAEVMAIPCDLLAELSRLSDDEATLFAGEYGIGPGEAIQVIEGAYRALNMVTFYTATGGEELRAWTLKLGCTALEAAGAIHSDFARGFIRAEAVGVDQLIESGSWAEARKAGLVRQEGKTYRVEDGDVLNIKFAI
ncbi:DUF933 domain-containing protein [Candidatus Zixiibacteriota bacterium]